MTIKFFRGDDHQEKFRFKNFTGTIEKMYFTVKCENRIVRIKKRLNEGIELIDGWYCITFEPKDTENLECDKRMYYDIQIFVEGKKYTVIKGLFVLVEDITTPECEV